MAVLLYNSDIFYDRRADCFNPVNHVGRLSRVIIIIIIIKLDDL